MSELANRLVPAVLAALPLEPESDGEMVVHWNMITTSPEDRAVEPNIPERYFVPEVDDATPVARTVAIAALRSVAEHFRQVGNVVHAVGDHLRAKGIDECRLALLDAVQEIERQA